MRTENTLFTSYTFFGQVKCGANIFYTNSNISILTMKFKRLGQISKKVGLMCMSLEKIDASGLFSILILVFYINYFNNFYHFILFYSVGNLFFPLLFCSIDKWIK